MMDFIAELQRRNVFRAATLYAAVAWLVVQVATQVLPVFGAPNWVLRMIVIVSVAGFPFVLAFSWFYELTPDGLKRESEIPRTESIAHLTGKKLNHAIIGVLSLLVVVLLANTFVAHHDADAVPDKSVAVLPMINEGGDASDQYFSDGLSEDLISMLSQEPELKVIGRNSSFRFRGDTTDSRGIAAKLGVATLLEGTVRRQGTRVRIVASLVSARDSRVLWSQVYEREVKDIFEVQSDIARSVAGALQVQLLGRAAASPLQPSNRDPAAHNALLEGNFHFERHTENDYQQAIDDYSDAIRRDPRYALAYAR
ncbi:MAG TPA: hypothetical protein VJ722_04185, partial [Rhodanobacteraceae bacterium]|nr:hypothetical protein [Rhodanobacteraceae bacterium]